MRSKLLCGVLVAALAPWAAIAASPTPRDAARAQSARQTNAPSARPPVRGQAQIDAKQAHDRKMTRAERRAKRNEALRSKARFFTKITAGRDYKGEHVVYRDGDVTAFLDLTDPGHPFYDPEDPLDVSTTGIDPAKLTHVLVVPNQHREWITPTLDTPIGSSDLKATLAIVEKAEMLAQSLGIQKARVFVNPDSFLTVGYLHVHILGERGPAPFPRLKP